MSTRFCRLVKEYIADERKASMRDYPALGSIAPSEAKRSIAGIGKQERGHRKTLIKLKRKYCGGK